jgi:hypothetical protein
LLFRERLDGGRRRILARRAVKVGESFETVRQHPCQRPISRPAEERRSTLPMQGQPPAPRSYVPPAWHAAGQVSFLFRFARADRRGAVACSSARCHSRDGRENMPFKKMGQGRNSWSFAADKNSFSAAPYDRQKKRISRRSGGIARSGAACGSSSLGSPDQKDYKVAKRHTSPTRKRGTFGRFREKNVGLNGTQSPSLALRACVNRLCNPAGQPRCDKPLAPLAWRRIWPESLLRGSTPLLEYLTWNPCLLSLPSATSGRAARRNAR